MNFNTKANTLEIIQSAYKDIVPNFLFFKKKSFLNNKNKYIKNIRSKFNCDIIIRSSAIDEDNIKNSNAGFYDSYIIKKFEFDEIEKKINKIISKFKNDNDQILIQKFIIKPDIAGVVFTKDGVI